MRFFLIIIFILNLAAVSIAGVYVFKYNFIETELTETVKLNTPAPIIVSHSPEIELPSLPEDTEMSVETPLLEQQDTSIKLKIITTPADAKVFVNGYYKGRTPVELKVVSTASQGEYRLVILKPGYQRWEKKLYLEPGEAKSYSMILSKDRKIQEK